MDDVDPRIGLCAACQHCRTIEGARSTFYMCERSFTDPRFRKYPSLPVVRCEGFSAKAAGTGKLER